jgi:heme A synthase
MTASLFRRYTWGVLALVLGVIAWGAYVRATGSGAGCGQHWPTCQGALIPRSPTAKTLVEFSHRLSSGLAFLAVAALVLVSRRAASPGSAARRAAGFAMGFMVAEALLGAGLVLFKLVADNASLARAAAMSLHLVNTFLLLGALALTAHFAAGGAPFRLRGQGPAGPALLGAFVAVCLLGISGAVTALGDTLFPAASLAAGIDQDLSPAAHLFVRLRLLHPMLGVLVGAYLAAAAALLARRPGPAVRARATAVGALFVVQLAAGAINLALLAPVWLQLVHLVLADLVWISLVLLAAKCLELAPEAAPRGAASVSARRVDSPAQ